MQPPFSLPLSRRWLRHWDLCLTDGSRPSLPRGRSTSSIIIPERRRGSTLVCVRIAPPAATRVYLWPHGTRFSIYEFLFSSSSRSSAEAAHGSSGGAKHSGGLTAANSYSATTTATTVFGYSRYPAAATTKSDTGSSCTAAAQAPTPSAWTGSTTTTAAGNHRHGMPVIENFASQL